MNNAHNKQKEKKKKESNTADEWWQYTLSSQKASDNLITIQMDSGQSNVIITRQQLVLSIGWTDAQNDGQTKLSRTDALQVMGISLPLQNSYIQLKPFQLASKCRHDVFFAERKILPQVTTHRHFLKVRERQ